MRKFSLINSKGESYDITTEDAFFHSPEGLGFQRNDTYHQVGSRYILANTSPSQGNITGKLILNSDDPYGDYQNFLDFCDDDLQLLYEGVGYRRSQYATENALSIDYAVAGGNASYIGSYDFISGVFKALYRKFSYGTYSSSDWSLVSGMTTSSCAIYECTVSTDPKEYVKSGTSVICNGLNSLATNETASLTRGVNGVCRSSDLSKIRICLRADALQGKTIAEWVESNQPEFLYTLAEPIETSYPNSEYSYPALYDVTLSSLTAYSDGTNSGDAMLDLIRYGANHEEIEETGSTIRIDGDFIKASVNKLEINPIPDFTGMASLPGRFGGTGNNLVSSTSRNISGQNNSGTVISSQELAYVAAGEKYQYYGEGVADNLIPLDSSPQGMSLTVTLTYTSLTGGQTAQIDSIVISDFEEDGDSYTSSFTFGGEHYETVSNPGSSANPAENGWYVYGQTYVPTEDETVDNVTTYYDQVVTYGSVTPSGNENPAASRWYEDSYSLSGDEVAVSTKTYYSVESLNYATAAPIGNENPAALEWYELVAGEYQLTSDTTVDPEKTYYFVSSRNYEKVASVAGGKNYCDPSKWVLGTVGATGSPTHFVLVNSTTAFRNTGIKLPAGTYTFSATDGLSSLGVLYVYKEDTGYMVSTKTNYSAVALPVTKTIADDELIALVVGKSVVGDDPSVIKVQIEAGSTATAYESYFALSPVEEGWYEKLDGYYDATLDDHVISNKPYYNVTSESYVTVTPTGDENPSVEGWFVRETTYYQTTDTVVIPGTTYYRFEDSEYTVPQYDGRIYLTVTAADCTNDATVSIRTSIISSSVDGVANDYLNESWQALKNLRQPMQSVVSLSAYDYKKYYRDVRISKVEKTEINLYSVLEVPIEFKCLSPWKNPFRVLTKTLSDSIEPMSWGPNEYKIQNGSLVEFTNEFTEVEPIGTENPSAEGWYVLIDGSYVLTEDTTVDPETTYYAFGVPFEPDFDDDESIWDITWGQEAKMSFIVDSDGALPSPCTLFIYGPATNPQWSHYANGVLLSEGSCDVNITADQYLVVDSSEDSFSILVFNKDGSLAFDAYQQSDFSKDLFMFLRYGENVINIANSGGTYNSDTRVGGYIYYESV